jgi:hypothetical protein
MHLNCWNKTNIFTFHGLTTKIKGYHLISVVLIEICICFALCKILDEIVCHKYGLGISPFLKKELLLTAICGLLLEKFGRIYTLLQLLIKISPCLKSFNYIIIC